MRSGRPGWKWRSVRLAAPLIACAWLPATAWADLRVSTLEHGPWPATVAALQVDLHSEGRTVHVLVTDENGHRAACGEYTLALDPAGGQAFALGTCDPGTAATALLLRQRRELFDHGDLVARPRAVGIAAVQTRTGAARGGAGGLGGSELSCSVAVRPYLRDLERGTTVPLVPGRFALRVYGAGVQAAPAGDGWTLRGGSAGLVVDYEVVDTQRREVVLRDRATLACGVRSLPVAGQTSLAPLAPGDASCVSAVALRHGMSVHGVASEAPSPGWVLDLERRAVVQLELASTAPVVMRLRQDCDGSTADLAHGTADQGTRATMRLALEPGTWYVAVQGLGAPARYQLETSVLPGDGVATEAQACAAALPLFPGGVIDGSTAGAADSFQGTCGGERSPERVYSLTLDRSARVRLDLDSQFDSALYVTDGCGAPAPELACTEDGPGTRHASVDLTLEAGTHFVYVDGRSPGQQGRFSLTAAIRPLGSPSIVVRTRPVRRR